MTDQSIQPSPLLSWRRTLYIMFLAQIISAIGFSSIFPFLPLYIQSLGSAYNFDLELLAGLVFSSQAFTMMIASPIWGAIADRYGRKLMVERAMFGGAVILFLMAFVRNAEELVLLRALQGLITGTISAGNALVAATAPRKHSGYAMGLMQVGLGSGIALGPMIGGAVADAFGYSAAFYVTGILLVVAGFMVLFGVKEDFNPPASKGESKGGYFRDWKRVLLTPGVTSAFVIRFLNQLGRMIFIPILPLFIAKLIVDASRVNSYTGIVIGLAAASTTVAAVSLGRLGDRIGHGKIIMFCSFFCFLFFSLQCLVTEGWQLLCLQTITGIGIGGIVPGISALLANITKRGEEGAVYGLDNAITSGARTLAPMIGVGIAMIMGFRAVFAAAALLYLMSTILASGKLTHRLYHS